MHLAQCVGDVALVGEDGFEGFSYFLAIAKVNVHERVVLFEQ